MSTPASLPRSDFAWGFTTAQVHAGQVPDPATGASALPIYQTASYALPDAATAVELFAGRAEGWTYSRVNNPTLAVVEERLAALEHGVAGILVASGQAAVSDAVMTLADAGDHVVASSSLYGGTRTLLAHNLARKGIAATFVDRPGDPSAWEAAITPRTRLLFGESIPNPRGDLLDIEAVAEVAHRHGVPLVVDNTVATPYLIRPLDWGADVVVHSATKYLSGHGAVIAGAVVDGGRFDFGADPARWPGFTTAVPGYGDLVIARDFGPGGARAPEGVNLGFAAKLRLEQLHDLGACLSAHSAFLLALGLETLSLRMDRHVSNAAAVADWLARRPDVASVTYSGLPDSPWRPLADRYSDHGAGAIVAFDLPGGAPACHRFLDALRLHLQLANIGDVRSLAIHPATTTHGQISAADQAQAGIGPGTIRLSVGIEDLPDVLADLELGFDAVSRAGLR
ncbi:O-acetylhomoserine aminocarboxypropyltransferase/cysteine synthase family protein [Schaalia naturae]|jgi:O-acetylhomoserine (thiol)-lyase|uniref:O-acetylhomoserine aminocarboxypropyltransferase/cysteine synthase family protein n=1 Tax=Schaalia naturae TaxID=635203 RepID=A0ABW2SNE9_9ACTO